MFLARAACYYNDLYREGAKCGIQVQAVQVVVDGDFGAVGEPAKNVTHQAKVAAKTSPEAIRDLMRHTDQVAEIQNTLRAAIPVLLSQAQVIRM